MSMATRELRIPYPEELPEAMDQTPDEFEREMRFLVAAKLYELGRITSGRAADMAGMQRVGFLNELGAHRISVWNYDADELEQEIEAAQDRARSRS
ncbi:putative HTH domain antitoxin [Salinibacter ruber]|nr:putative HTH domain antitoxin [Salinibacter ruber]